MHFSFAIKQHGIMTQDDGKRKAVAVLLQSHFEDGMDGCCLDRLGKRQMES